MIIGYTTGVYDMFHIGHLNIIKRAKEQCDYLIVGVSTDSLVQKEKNKTPVIPYQERVAIVSAIKYVDKVVPQYSKDKIGAWNEYHFDRMFVGSDWKNTPQWDKYEQEFKPLGVEIIYLPHTDGISSTMKKYSIGYTQGVYDMFHIGHLNLINQAKQYCDYLIVGVNADSLVQNYKNKTPVINEKERQTIVANIKAVDECIIATTLDKSEIWKQYHQDAVFIGDDWKGHPRWTQTKADLAEYGVDVVFLPHTPDISSTILRAETDNKVDE